MPRTYVRGLHIIFHHTNSFKVKFFGYWMAAIYYIDSFSRLGPSLIGWDIRTSIDERTALKLRKIRLEKDIFEMLQTDARETISGFQLDESEKIENPLRFVDDSRLLWEVKVPGNSCDLSLEDSEKGNFVENFPAYEESYTPRKPVRDGEEPRLVRYKPHNVDTQQQASALLSLWLNWANLVARTV